MKRDHVLNKYYSSKPQVEASVPPPIIQAESPVEDKKSKQPIDYSTVNRSFRKGEMYFSRGDLAEAEKWFIKVLSLHEHHEEAINRLGVIYIQQKQFGKAEILFRKLVSLNEKEAVYYSNFGRCLYGLGKLDEAIAMYTRAVNLEPDRINRLVSLGQIYFELKRHEEALEQFLKAYDHDHRNLEYLGYLADLYEVMGKKHDLRLMLEKMIELDPYNEVLQTRFKKLTQTDAPLQA